MAQTTPSTDPAVWVERAAFVLAGVLPAVLALRAFDGSLNLDTLGDYLASGGTMLAFACALRARRLQRLTTLLWVGVVAGVVAMLAGGVLLVIALFRHLPPG